jgi:hypothetical protein
LENCATELLKIAADYKNMANVLKDKDIKVNATDGNAHCGCFNVDDIDAGRLKKSGLIADHDEIQSDWKTFFIDSELDEELAEALKDDESEEEESEENLHLEDYEDPDDLDASDDLVFDPKAKVFTFRCPGCEKVHVEKLQTIYHGLAHLLDNLIEYNETDDEEREEGERQELVNKIVKRDWEVSFIKHLLEQEYGMTPTEIDAEDAEDEEDEIEIDEEEE